ncbi:hypothetical protein WICANDRAFT_31987 [Wickerhamomyces anomalus NRRL Y-366-8]|uniref:Protein BFR2 n=1 Tax=Wickerhamomyces anomalus (strain ATCC 58044 / CBS 1984 / NCYC 433 / NRRL Y-366-8) TaxID=683960 RepID=A0A1E3P067_WICAA|nr:uncharacterized protein WICANDRAFT_31987 [Wickerhamomyces anomalus NRRL Y-366-8]ODQ58745.1 hypothetical protein WICANDRAFT_31987 [Wickerhamomyces anomalus NRRL Y-366-8]
MAKKSLAEQIAELQKPEVEDYDIEDAERDVFNHDDEENASLGEDEEDEVKRTEHYVNVGKSKLRDHSVNLKDPKYTGKTSSRKDIFENKSEDELQSENEEEEGDESDSGISLRADSEDEEQSESESEPSTDEETVTSKRDKLKQMMATERKTILNRLSTSAQNDALKGYAVISQQRLFDNILDSRIKLQKGLTNSNLLPLNNESFEEFQEESTQEDLGNVENSLHSLLDNIISLRTKICNKEKITKDQLKFNTGKKRSFGEYVEETEKLDNVLNKYRGSVLTKWSHKVQSASGATALNASKFKTINQTPAQQVDLNLMDMDRLLKRTRLNRRNVKPLGYADEEDGEENTKKVDRSLQEDENIFDDEDFYRVLLNDLIDKKISDSNPTNGLTIQLTKAKVKKNVDTKASKGRKLKYTVQEPLQNFEAPKSKFKWSDEQIDEFFAGLLGQRVNFDEADENGDNEEDEDDESLLQDDIKIFG